MKLRLSLSGLIVFFLLTGLISGASSVDRGYIYGKITMKNGDTYEGPIRWGKEETFWDDMFNSTKTENEFVDELSDEDLETLEKNYSRSKKRRGFINIDFNDGFTTHQFVCRFGDIKQLRMIGREAVLITFKNGDEIEVEGGSNDINAKIKVLDKEIGDLTLKWNRIRNIEFMSVKEKPDRTFGDPLYGTVETESGKFSGYIQWDHEECVKTDKLDGEYDDGDMSIEFGKITSIEKHRRGALIKLRSGKEYYLYGTNDVNHDNKGVIVKNKNIGKVLIEWDEFLSVKFEDSPKENMLSYDEFEVPKKLKGTVKTKDDESITGRIVYDLDESLNIELLDGEYDNMKYKIPFKNIKTIAPIRRYSSEVTLRSGEILQLEETQDVSRRNDGLLIWGEGKKPRYVAWTDIELISFE